MRLAQLAHNEAERLCVVDDFQIEPDSMVAGELNRIARLAADLFRVPIALVTFVERDRQVFLARVGLEERETGRDVSFCAHAIHSPDVFIVLDAALDARFIDNALVTGPPHVRFYAGAPLVGSGGHVLGALCIIDSKPRGSFPLVDRALLIELAGLVVAKLELHRLDKARSISHARFEAAARTSPDGAVSTDHRGTITHWNAASERMFGLAARDVLGTSLQLLISPSLDPVAGALNGIEGEDQVLPGETIALLLPRADGTKFPAELSVLKRTDEGVTRFECIAEDVTERRATEDRLYRLAHFDALTGLPNATVLKARLAELDTAIDAACVLSIDLDGFKDVNDTFGHLVGDGLLISVAQRLLACAGPFDTVARMGGDEFAMILPGIGDPSRAAAIADRVMSAIADGFVVDEQSVNISASVGFAIHPTFNENASELLSNADLALYQAKAEGRHCRRMFLPALRERARHKRTQDFELRRAFERGEFEIFYQPQVRLGDGALVGAEALLRWNHPTKGLLSPAAFLPNLETGPLAAPVGYWVLDHACQQAAQWRAAGAADFRIGVNLFGAQFETDSLVDRVRTALASSGLSPEALELEITENIILRHDEEMAAPLRALRALGVGVAFDDYGTGYASLSMLKTVPLTRLKLDQSFVRGIGESEGDVAIVHSVLYLGEKFRLDVIAEGVETEAQRKMLIAEGCTTAQGYLFGRAMPADAFSAKFGLA